MIFLLKILRLRLPATTQEGDSIKKTQIKKIKIFKDKMI